jgi:hypothetical protein
MGKAPEEVVFGQPNMVEPTLVGVHDLIDRLADDSCFSTGFTCGYVHFIEYAEFHVALLSDKEDGCSGQIGDASLGKPIEKAHRAAALLESPLSAIGPTPNAPRRSAVPPAVRLVSMFNQFDCLAP